MPDGYAYIDMSKNQSNFTQTALICVTKKCNITQGMCEKVTLKVTERPFMHAHRFKRQQKKTRTHKNDESAHEMKKTMD